MGTNWRQQAPQPLLQLILRPWLSSVSTAASTTRSAKTCTSGNICRKRVGPAGMVILDRRSQSGEDKVTVAVTVPVSVETSGSVMGSRISC